MIAGNLTLGDLRAIVRAVWPVLCEGGIAGELEGVHTVNAILHGDGCYVSEEDAARVRALAAEIKARRAQKGAA